MWVRGSSWEWVRHAEEHTPAPLERGISTLHCPAVSRGSRSKKARQRDRRDTLFLLNSKARPYAWDWACYQLHIITVKTLYFSNFTQNLITMNKKLKIFSIGLIITVIGIAMFRYGTYMFSYSGPPITEFESKLGEYCFFLWLPVFGVGVVLIIASPFIKNKKV